MGSCSRVQRGAIDLPTKLLGLGGIIIRWTEGLANGKSYEGIESTQSGGR